MSNSPVRNLLVCKFLVSVPETTEGLSTKDTTAQKELSTKLHEEKRRATKELEKIQGDPLKVGKEEEISNIKFIGVHSCPFVVRRFPSSSFVDLRG